jgi:Arc/MetJ family transcription regulator
MTRFSITVDEDLIEEALALADTRTKRETIEQALREFVQRRRLLKLADLIGAGLLDLDPADLRRWREMSTINS